MRNLFLLISLFLAVSINVFAQVKEITFEESHQQSVAAFKKEYKGKWRINLTHEYFKDEKLYFKTETVTENDVFGDRLRIVKTEISGENTKKFELIRIKEVFYCRENNISWKKFDDWCEDDKLLSGSSGEEESAKYTFENAKLNNQNAKLYRQYVINTDGKTKTYWDYKFWVSANGFILRREIESGLLNPQTITHKMTETREYNVKNIRIVAPIISTKKN